MMAREQIDARANRLHRETRQAPVKAGRKPLTTRERLTRTRCTAYLRSRGLFRYSGRRCTLDAGHLADGVRHSTPRNGIGAPFVFRWGRIAR